MPDAQVRERLIAFYAKHEPSKVDHVDEILSKVNPERLNGLLIEKYGEGIFSGGSAAQPPQPPPRGRAPKSAAKSGKKKTPRKREKKEGGSGRRSSVALLRQSVRLDKAMEKMRSPRNNDPHGMEAKINSAPQNMSTAQMRQIVRENGFLEKKYYTEGFFSKGRNWRRLYFEIDLATSTLHFYDASSDNTEALGFISLTEKGLKVSVDDEHSEGKRKWRFQIKPRNQAPHELCAETKREREVCSRKRYRDREVCSIRCTMCCTMRCTMCYTMCYTMCCTTCCTMPSM
jgi:hypothetical protein